jgi:hypothetical protein
MSRLPAKRLRELVRRYSSVGRLELVEEPLKGVRTIRQCFLVFGGYLVYGLGL